MSTESNNFIDYYAHLKCIRLTGRIYKKYYASPILYFCARRFGRRIAEVGSGIGSGILGAFPKTVTGLEINPLAVEHCIAAKLNAHLIESDGNFPVADGSIDACVLDNVLEHIENPAKILDECHRITKKNGGLIIAVPGIAGYRSDGDHKKFYDSQALRNLDKRWMLVNLFSTPFFVSNKILSKHVKQYCLVATFKRI